MILALVERLILVPHLAGLALLKQEQDKNSLLAVTLTTVLILIFSKGQCFWLLRSIQEAGTITVEHGATLSIGPTSSTLQLSLVLNGVTISNSGNNVLSGTITVTNGSNTISTSSLSDSLEVTGAVDSDSSNSGSLTLTGAGSFQFDSSIGGNNALAAFTASNTGSLTLGGSNINTVGNQSYTPGVTFNAGSTTLQTTGSGSSINFTDGFNTNGNNVSLQSFNANNNQFDFNLDLTGSSVNATNEALTINSSSTTNLNGNITASGYDCIERHFLQAPVILGFNSIVTAGSITFDSTIDDNSPGAKDSLYLESNANTLMGDVGDTNPIGNLVLTAPGGPFNPASPYSGSYSGQPIGNDTISAASITTDGDQLYENNVTFTNGTSTTLTTTSGNSGNIYFGYIFGSNSLAATTATFNSPTTTITADNIVSYYGQVAGTTAIDTTSNGSSSATGADIAASFGTALAPLASITFNSSAGDILDFSHTGEIDFYATNTIAFNDSIQVTQGSGTSTMSAANIQFNSFINVDTNTSGGTLTLNLHYTGTNSYSSGGRKRPTGIY